MSNKQLLKYGYFSDVDVMSIVPNVLTDMYLFFQHHHWKRTHCVEIYGSIEQVYKGVKKNEKKRKRKTFEAKRKTQETWNKIKTILSWFILFFFQHLSTSPEQEPPNYVSHVRGSLSILRDHPEPQKTLFTRGPRIYRKNQQGQWTLVDHWPVWIKPQWYQ